MQPKQPNMFGCFSAAMGKGAYIRLGANIS
jgi:hypothetical protein